MIINNNSLNFLACTAKFEEADIIIFGAPFDGTTSYRPGARFAPNAIRTESIGLEEYSPYMEKSLLDYSICDIGDLEFSTNTDNYLPEIGNLVDKIMSTGKKPLMIGGEHLVSLPAVQNVYKKYTDLCLLHFDAHTDLRTEFLGNQLSHATVIYKCWELLGDKNIYQFGIRSGDREEFKWAQKHICLTKFTTKGIDEAINIIKNKPVYVTIDLDILDPSIFPGTGTPEPGGISFQELVNTIVKLNKLNIVGADIVELAPHYDQSGVSTIVACKIIREMLLAMNK